MNYNDGDKTDEEYYDYVCKAVLVGESGVGKTNILSRFCKDEFMHNSQATLGVEFATKVIDVDNKKLRIQIWDTAGQERYKSITNSYYINAKGALAVFDITKYSSFQKIDKWVSDLKQIAGKDITIIMVGNKGDLKNIRAVTREEAEQKAQELGDLIYIETSALNNTHINDVFQTLSNSKIYIYKTFLEIYRDYLIKNEDEMEKIAANQIKSSIFLSGQKGKESKSGCSC